MFEYCEENENSISVDYEGEMNDEQVKFELASHNFRQDSQQGYQSDYNSQEESKRESRNSPEIQHQMMSYFSDLVKLGNLLLEMKVAQKRKQKE